MVVGMFSDVDFECLVDCFGSCWVLLEILFKFYVLCCYIYFVVDVLLVLMQCEGFDYLQIVVVIVWVYQGVIDVFGWVVELQIVYQVKFFMGIVLGLIVVYGKVGFGEFYWYVLSDLWVVVFCEWVEMCLDLEVDVVYLQCWFGWVEVLDCEGWCYIVVIDEFKGDFGNIFSCDELVDKFCCLLVFFGVVIGVEVEIFIQCVWGLCQVFFVMFLI